MKTSNIIQIQKILEIALKHCTPGQYMTFVAWLLDSLKYDATALTIAERTNSNRQNVGRDFNGLVKNGVLAKGSKQKVPGSKQWKNTYSFGPVFNEILGVIIDVKTATPTLSGFIPKASLGTFETVKKLATSLYEIVQTHKLKVNRGDGKLLILMNNKISALETRIREGNYKHLDYKIQDIVDFAQSNRAWIKNRTDNLFWSDIINAHIQLPSFDDLNLPTLKDMKNEKAEQSA